MVAAACNAARLYLLISALQHELTCDDGVLLVARVSMPAKLSARAKFVDVTVKTQVFQSARK